MILTALRVYSISVLNRGFRGVVGGGVIRFVQLNIKQ